ncbi:hypothetical protein PVK06_005446 [Gossypium arboreum]|uniref:Uncharacterized protein n=1 Tax=Gossypium arboreum TaxID=29729 RepID=A0ABR0QVL9_GOSAR|nr:hypothetical protein PVK06_005446 [Gossypium arboreum]
MESFVRSQGVQGMEWPKWLSDLFEGNEGTIEQQEDEDKEIDYEAAEDDNFTSYQGNFENAFASARQQKGGLIIREPSNQPWIQSSSKYPKKLRYS